MLETETLALEIIPCARVKLSVVLLRFVMSMTGTVGVCATEGRAVDELGSTLEMNGASVDSGDIVPGASAYDEADRV